MITPAENSMPPEQPSAFVRISSLEGLVRQLRLTIMKIDAEKKDLQQLLQYVAYQRLPLGETVFEHLDMERQKKIVVALKNP